MYKLLFRWNDRIISRERNIVWYCVVFRWKEILIRWNKIIIRGNEIIIREDEIITRERIIMSRERNNNFQQFFFSQIPFKAFVWMRYISTCVCFLLQACRGILTDVGVEIPSGPSESDNQVYIPVEADFMLAFSTIPGMTVMSELPCSSNFKYL